MDKSQSDKISLLQRRLQEIAEGLKADPDGLGLLGLGSAGKDQHRMDEYSDLDFFAIVAQGQKQRFIDDLSWLSQKQPVVWKLRNTPDGYKLFFADGVFCEFAVLEPQELAHIAYSEGRYIWKDPSLSEALTSPQLPLPERSEDEAFLLGELLSNLYVGLCRYRRGEKLSAMRFIQVYAIDRLIGLLENSLLNEGNSEDAFCLERRVEQRYPQYQKLLDDCCQGSCACDASALAMLDFVNQHYEIDAFIENEIRRLL